MAIRELSLLISQSMNQSNFYKYIGLGAGKVKNKSQLCPHLGLLDGYMIQEAVNRKTTG